MTYEITTRTLREQPTAACEAELPATRVGPWLAEAYALVWQFLQRLEIVTLGPPFARYTFDGDRMRVEAGFPIAHGIRGEGSVHAGLLPAGRVAVTTHVGPYEALEDAYKAIAAWLAEHGYQQAGPHWEVYYTDPAQQPDSSQWRTGLFVPYVGMDRPAEVGVS